MADPRLGFRDNTGEITTNPTQYANGASFIVENYSGATLHFFDVNNFTPLPPGFPTLASIDPTLESTLSALIGSSGVIGDIDSVLSSLDLEDVEPLTIFDHFVGSTLSTDNWNTDTNGAASGVTQPNTGLTVAALTTGTDDDGHATLTSDQTFLSSSTLTLVEARVRLDDVAEVAIEFGLNDAASETGGLAFSSHDATPVAVADNAAVFGFLHDTAGGETNTNWSALSVNATTANRIDTSTAPAANTFVLLQVVLAYNSDTDAVDASWFINGTQVATFDDAVAKDIPLYAWLTVKTLEAADAKTADADYLRLSQDL